MDAPVVDVRALRKVYRVTERETGLAATFRSFVRRRYCEVLAVDGITFHIDPGEVVGFLGPNRAGKTTTLKMLSGLLYPTGGEAVDLYPLRLRVSLSTIVPIGIAVTAPANAIAGRIDAVGVALLGAGTVLAVGISSALWRRGLRSYTGASA